QIFFTPRSKATLRMADLLRAPFDCAFERVGLPIAKATSARSATFLHAAPSSGARLGLDVWTSSLVAGVFCLPWNLTAPPPWYAHGQEPVHVEAPTSEPQQRAEGRAVEAPPPGEGPRLGPVRREQAAAERLLRLAAPAVRQRADGLRRP